MKISAILIIFHQFDGTMRTCPGIDRLRDILAPQELELLQVRYNEIASVVTPFDSFPAASTTNTEPLLCSAWRLGRIRGAVGNAMPATVFAR